MCHTKTRGTCTISTLNHIMFLAFVVLHAFGFVFITSKQKTETLIIHRIVFFLPFHYFCRAHPFWVSVFIGSTCSFWGEVYIPENLREMKHFVLYILSIRVLFTEHTRMPYCKYVYIPCARIQKALPEALTTLFLVDEGRKDPDATICGSSSARHRNAI